MKRKRKWKRARPSFKNLCRLMKEILDKEVKATISRVFIASPHSIVISSCGWTALQWALGDNFDHPIVDTLKQEAEADMNDKAVKDHVVLLFETTALSLGFSLRGPQT